MTSSASLYRHALRYAEEGFFVLPLHTPTEYGCSCLRDDCTSVGKHPRTRNGVKDASNDREEIDRWWGRLWPEANIGIACGPASRVVVLDVDPRNGGSKSLRQLIDEHGHLPPTTAAYTGGGGKHFYFRHVEGARKCVVAPGLDFVGDGGYVLVPPSRHPSGDSYRWVGGEPLGSQRLPAPPAWLYRASRSTVRGFSLPSADDLTDITSGERNNTLIRIAGALRRWGLSTRAIDAALQVHNVEACNPPLPEVEVQKIAQSAGRYEPDYGEDESQEGHRVSVKISPVAT